MGEFTVLTTTNGAATTKTFSHTMEGNIAKLTAGMSKYFLAETRSFDTIHDLAAILEGLSLNPSQFVIRGELIPGIDPTQPLRRLKYSSDDAGATFQRAQTGRNWVCMDFDKVPCPHAIDAARSPEQAMRYLSRLLPVEFHRATFWAQWSASAGLDCWRTLSAHLWFTLDRSVADDDLRQWAKALGVVDYRLFDPIQAHFTAAPIFSDRADDPCEQRTFLCRRDSDIVTFNINEVAHDSRRIPRHSRTSRPIAARDRPTARAGGASSGSGHQAMGGGRRENTRTRRGRHQIHEGASIKINMATGEITFT